MADIEYEDDYVQPVILRALASRLPRGVFKLVTPDLGAPGQDIKVLTIKQYESLDFEKITMNPHKYLANSYVIRKALIRKHYLGATVLHWTTKHPTSVLSAHFKQSCDFELDYAEFLDDALVDAWDLKASFTKNLEAEPEHREWWILKPGMSDRGQGIRLFSSQEELQSIFDGWEADSPSSDCGSAEAAADTGLMISQLRHFVAQPYIDRPLLFPADPRKFHVRTYVLCVGALRVYVYKDMLALFAASAYRAPWATAEGQPDLSAHLTNTCLQTGAHDGAVQPFSSLPDVTANPALRADWKDAVLAQVCAVAGEVFEAAARSMSTSFQPLPNAFEIFGLDFLVDEDGTAWLLECNAFPDFRQSGPAAGQELVRGLWECVVDVAVAGFFGLAQGEEDNENVKLICVKDLDLGRR
jgi:tubulin--tyrosine ligase